MTKLLESALKQARSLPKNKQDRLARVMLDEIESAKAWDDRFAKTRKSLAKIAKGVLERDRRGESVEKGWDEL